MFCSKCGKEIDDNVNFCKFCGFQVNSLEENLRDDFKKEEDSIPNQENKEFYKEKSSVNSSKLHSKEKKSNSWIFIVVFVCLILAGITVYFSQNSDENTLEPEDVAIKVASDSVKKTIDENDSIPEPIKKVAKENIDKVDSKEELDKVIDDLNKKIEKFEKEKNESTEKIDKLLNELESFKSKNFSKEEKKENVSNDKKDSDSTENIVDSVIGFFKSLTGDKDSKEEKKEKSSKN